MATRDRGHPLARHAWSALRDRSEADRRLVFAALQRRLEVGPTTEKQEVALHALLRVQKLSGSDRAPSRREYDTFRDCQPKPQSWPSVQLIRNAYGSWTTARAAAEGRPLPDFTARRLAARGSRLDKGQVREIIATWAETVPVDKPLLQDDFLAWCKEQLGDPNCRFERLPQSDGGIRAVFGGWPEALAAIDALERRSDRWTGGAVEDEAEVDETDDPGEAKGGGSLPDLATAPPGRSGIYRHEDLVNWLKWMASGLRPAERRQLSMENYDGWRRVLIRRAQGEGRILRIPSTATLIDRLGGSWPKAKLAAGLLRPADAVLQPNRLSYELEELREALVAACHASACRSVSDLPRATYRKWREARLAELANDDPRTRIASVALLLKRLGGPTRSWKVVLVQFPSRRNRLPSQRRGRGGPVELG